MKPGRTLALIPAKGASSRLKRKNLSVVGGKTLVARAVECALDAGGFASVVVTTEDAEISQEALRAGAEVPFLRPERLAVDPAGVVDVVLHALDELEKRGKVYDTVTILLPTSPLRTPEDVRKALAQYAQGEADFLMSVSSYEHTPLAALTVAEDGTLTPLMPQWMGKLGAAAVPGSLPKVVRANGAIAICDVRRLRETRTYYSYPLAAYEMPLERSIDIDSELDARLAELLLHQR